VLTPLAQPAGPRFLTSLAACCPRAPAAGDGAGGRRSVGPGRGARQVAPAGWWSWHGSLFLAGEIRAHLRSEPVDPIPRRRIHCPETAEPHERYPLFT
jgi:hypothetical protein